MKQIDLLDASLRNDFACFIAKSFACVDPSSKYLDNWHINLIASRLEAAYRGDIKRLIINVPPRSLKSVCTSVAWPAWILGKNPSAKIIVASYSQILSLKHSLDCRLIMQSDWYGELFPETLIAHGQNEKHKFTTTKRGFRFATSVGGTLTGEGGDYLIIDDPHSPAQAISEAKRKAAIDWFSQTFMSRLNNKKKGVVVLVMQRLHVDDLTGNLYGKGWHHLNLPAIADKDKIYKYDGTTYKRRAGEMLHPGREGASELKRAKDELGSYAFAAQYQQAPYLQEGGMVELQWFRRYKKPPDDGLIYQSWDTAIKAGAKNDFSVCTTWAVSDNMCYLLDVFAQKMEYPQLKRCVLSLAKKYNPAAILIEDKASGQSLLQDLRREEDFSLIAIKAIADKLSRFAATTAMIEAGWVWLPFSASWLTDYEAQLLSFPNSAHDDMVDSTSGFLNWYRGKKKTQPTMRVL